MGKKTRNRRGKKSRATPYKVDKMVEDTTTKDGLEGSDDDDTEARKTESIIGMIDEGEAGGEDEEEESKGETKGKMLRRHNMEWKNIRRQMNELKKSRFEFRII